MSISSTVNMMSKVVLGAGDMLDIVARVWAELSPGETVLRVEVSQHEDYSFDDSVLESHDPATSQLFVAFDERFGNFKRAELMQVAMSRKFQLATIQAPGSIVAADAKIGRNVFVGAGAIVSAGAVVDYNSVIHAGATIGFGAKLKASCWVESGVNIGARAEIGAHATLRTGVIIAPSVKIGRYCEIGVPGHYRADVAAKTVFDPRYDEPLIVYGG
jgi:acetyltransferase-like isoleucine patch superfamily enzyme